MMPENWVSLEVLEHQLHQAHRNAIQAELARAGLQEVGHPILLCILRSAQDSPGQPHSPAQRELAERLNISPAAVATSLKSLERNGYILRAPDRDARRNQVSLTPKGERAVEDCLECFRRVSQRMFLNFEPEEQAVLSAFYRRMLSNLHPADPSHHPSLRKD